MLFQLVFESLQIPTTRAISPKLGRHKVTASTASNSLENGGQCVSPRVSTRDNCKSPKAPQANSDKGNDALKKFVKSSLSKPHTRESTTARKAKHADTEGEDKQTYAHNSEEILDRPRCSPELEEQTEDGPEKNSSYGSILDSSNPEAMPAEVTS